MISAGFLSHELRRCMPGICCDANLDETMSSGKNTFSLCFSSFQVSNSDVMQKLPSSPLCALCVSCFLCPAFVIRSVNTIHWPNR